MGGWDRSWNYFNHTATHYPPLRFCHRETLTHWRHSLTEHYVGSANDGPRVRRRPCSAPRQWRLHVRRGGAAIGHPEGYRSGTRAKQFLFSPFRCTTQDHTDCIQIALASVPALGPTRGPLGSLESLPAVYLMNGVVPLVASRKLRGPSASRAQCGLGGYWGMEPDALSGSSHRFGFEQLLRYFFQS